MAHLRIGRLLAARTPPEHLEENIFDIVNQFDRGSALISTEREREQVATLLLISGPIVDYPRYFSHKRLMYEFTALGFAPVKLYNLSVFWRPLSSRIVANFIKLPFGYTLLDWLPERKILPKTIRTSSTERATDSDIR